MRPWPLLLLAACAHSAPAAPTPPREPIALTYLGGAGWQLDAAGKTILTDPYFSRPSDPNQPLDPDSVAKAAHAPAHTDQIVVGKSHNEKHTDAAERLQGRRHVRVPDPERGTRGPRAEHRELHRVRARRWASRYRDHRART